ncbi:MAG: ABC transporter transmembrane domain-containing protein, partial [Cyclobacteriaceae bacterium]|nr:ABC transporter transmembrane domain-containing protein [Cyclobacteriaceae bacterium]
MVEEKKEKVPLNKENFKKLLGVFRFILPYKWKFFIGILCLFISSFLVLSFPILSGKLLDVASGEEWVITGGDLMEKIDQNGDQIIIDNVTQVAYLLMGMLLLQSIFSFVRVYLFAIVTENSIADMRKTVFTKMLNLPLKFFDGQRVGDMISRLTSDISIVQETFSITSAELFRQVTMLFIGLAVIFVLVPKLALFMIAIFPAVILVAVFFGRSIKKLSKKSQGHLG